jgi:hypothetical protein
MKKNVSFIDEFAVSEVVGAMLLVLIAIIAFAAIYLYVFPLPLPAPEPNVKLMGYVNDDGTAVIEHMGGESLSEYRIDVRKLDGTLINTTTYKKENDPWKIGECKYPPTNTPLLTENHKVNIDVYEIYNDGSEHQVFTGILTGKRKVVEPSIPSMLMLISSLRTDTIDEDLICYNYTINSSIDASTYIYNWSVNGNPIMNLLMPFDTNSSIVAKDYSGNGHNGTVVGPIWINGGRVGGAYQFDGDDYISLPYCFDENNFIDEITVETWIKTNKDSIAIASFDRNIFWDLGITNGVARWSTNANDHTTDTMGVTSIIDGNWHHVAATYDSSSGECSIYTDGELDKKENGHNPLEELGTGSVSDGFIGHSIGGVIPGSWNELTYDDFEAGWRNYVPGSNGTYADCYRSTSYKHEGTTSACIRDNSGTASAFTLNTIDIDTPAYKSLKIDFWWMWRGNGWATGEDWWLLYYNGTAWVTVLDVNYPSSYTKGIWYHTIVYINESNYRFPTNMRLRFQCDASYDDDLVYIDQIYVNATAGNMEISNFSGFIDEFRIYNRALSPEQIYQNYLCMKDGRSDKSVIVSEEITPVPVDIWKCFVTPNDGIQDDISKESNIIQIVPYLGGE